MRPTHAGITGTGYFGSHPAEATYLASTLGQLSMQPLSHPHNANMRPIGAQRNFPKKNTNFQKKINTSDSALPEAKTPLMLINEGSAKAKKILDWELNESGQNADKTYTYSVRVREPDRNIRPDDLNVEGISSKSKKTAKQLCAIELLKAIVAQRIHCANFSMPPEHDAALQFIARKAKEIGMVKIEGNQERVDAIENPLAQVHLLCMSLHISAPEYKFFDPIQPGQNFVCTANLGKFMQRGTGSSKKAAKREAVKDYIPLLLAIKEDKDHIAERLEKEMGIIQDKVHNVKKIRPPKAPQVKLSEIDPGTTIKTLPELLNGEISDYHSILEKIIVEQGGQIRMTIIELALRPDGSHQCHLALQCPSYVYFYGFGESKNAAIQSASINALQFINDNVNQ